MALELCFFIYWKRGRPSWTWSYGSWIYNYLCNQCLSPLNIVSSWWAEILLKVALNTINQTYISIEFVKFILQTISKYCFSYKICTFLYISIFLLKHPHIHIYNHSHHPSCLLGYVSGPCIYNNLRNQTIKYC